MDQLLQGSNLNNMGFTSRIAFYALYEAWRLLQEISGFQPQLPMIDTDYNTRDSNRRSRRARRSRNNISNLRNVNIGGGGSETESTAQVQPDLVESTQHDELSSVAQCESVDKCAAHEIRNLDSEISEEYLELTINDESEAKEVKSVNCLPDLIPTNEFSDHSSDDDDLSETSVLKMESLVSECFKLGLSCSRSEWTAVGAQLCTLASALEDSYLGPENSSQRKLHETYQSIKLQLLKRARESSAQTDLGLVKTIGKQILLSGIWVLLKKVL